MEAERAMTPRGTVRRCIMLSRGAAIMMGRWRVGLDFMIDTICT